MEFVQLEYDNKIFGELMPYIPINTEKPIETLLKKEVDCPKDKFFINKSYIKKIEDISKSRKKKKSILLFGLGNVGGTLLIALRILLDNNIVSHIGIYDKNEFLTERYELEINQIHPPDDDKQVPIKPLKDLKDISEYDIILFSAAAQIPPLGIGKCNVRDIQFPPNKRILDSLIDNLRNTKYMGSIIIVSDPVDILCTYLQRNLDILASQITGMGLGVMAARANYILEKKGINNFYKDGQIFGPHNDGVIAIPHKSNSKLKEIREISEQIEHLNFDVRKRGYFPYIAPAVSSVAYNLQYALQGKEVLSCILIDGIYWGFVSRYINGLWVPVPQAININFLNHIKNKFFEFKARTLRVLEYDH